MLSTYVQIAGTIGEQVKQIRWIDLDKGQLDDPTKFHSLITPSVLIGCSDIEWLPLSRGLYQGQGTITVKTIFNLGVPTNMLDPNLIKGLEILELADQVNQATLSVPGIKSLANSKDYPVLTFFVVENTYNCLFKSGPGISYKTVNVKFNPVIYNTHAQA